MSSRERKQRRLKKRYAKEKAVVEVALRVGGPEMAQEVRTKFNKQRFDQVHKIKKRKENKVVRQ